MDNLIGKRLDGRYLLEQLVGVGGMANIYRARDLRLQRTVAVKILREEFWQNAEVVRQFKNESKAISILEHPNIVKVFDVSITDKLNYIVMEYIEGITLKEYMKQRSGPLTWKEVTHFTSQILEALEHAHSRGVVHRDVKPQNIMLQADGTLKMMDFGIARFSRAQHIGESGSTMGSAHYISPEQASGVQTGAETDIYSVGVMMYEMLAGRLPFQSGNPREVAIKQISAQAPPLRQLAPNSPLGIIAITERAMAKNPANRYPNASAMLKDLNLFKKNPDIRFDYRYVTEDTPTRYISNVANKPQKQSTAPRRTSTAARSSTAAQPAAPRRTAEKSAARSSKRGGIAILPILAGITAACVVVTVFLCYNIFSNSTNALFSDRADVELIDFVGMTRQQVENNALYDKLSVQFSEEYNSNYEAGIIYNQTPKSGRTVKEGQTVTLKVSLGTLYVPVPDVSNMLQADAQQTLKDQGLTVSVRPNYVSGIAVGTVVETDPVAGTEIASGSTVTIYVSKEKVNTNRTVPSVINLTVEDAKTALQNSGLTLGTQTEGYSDLPAGTIFEQSVAAGTQVRVNTSISVSVSMGPAPVVEAAPVPETNNTTPEENYDERPLWWFLPEDQRPKTW